MRLRQATAVLALVGALLLLLVGLLGFLGDAGWHGGVALAGYALTLLALALAGYLLVETAPIWLGIIVGVCTPLLAASLWQAIAPALDDKAGHGDALTWLVAGVIALVLAGFLALLVRRSADRSAGHPGGHSTDRPADPAH